MTSENDSTNQLMREVNTNRWFTGARIPNTQTGIRSDPGQLYMSYASAVYAFLRRSGKKPEDAEDLTQGFFVHLLKNDQFRKYSPEFGRFRNFLIKCLKNYVCNQWDADASPTRGGDVVHISIDDADEVEGLLEAIPSPGRAPHEEIDKKPARELKEQILNELQAEYVSRGKGVLFESLLPFVQGEAKWGGYADVAASLKMSKVATRKAVHDLRKRFERECEKHHFRETDVPLYLPGSAEDVYHKLFARTLFKNVFKLLKKEYSDEEKGDLFDALQPFLGDKAGRGDYAKPAVKLQMSEEAVRSAAGELRQKFNKLRRMTLAEIAPVSEVDAEAHDLTEAARLRRLRAPN